MLPKCLSLVILSDFYGWGEEGQNKWNALKVPRGNKRNILVLNRACPVDDNNICLSSAPVELWCWMSIGNEAAFNSFTAEGAVKRLWVSSGGCSDTQRNQAGEMQAICHMSFQSSK